MITLGVLAYQGDVIEHIEATQNAAKNLEIEVHVRSVRTKQDLKDITALIIPGGESTVLYKLSLLNGTFDDIRKIHAIFGTCAGAIMLAKNVIHRAEDQRTLSLMDITVDRNAYGRQVESFESGIDTKLGTFEGIFIRAPKIKKVGRKVTVLGRLEKDIVLCEQQSKNHYYLAASFHPELVTTKIHEYFLQKITHNVS